MILVITSNFMVGPDIDYSNPVHIQHIANDFPTLQIVISHACYPWTMQMINLLLVCPNIWLIPDMYMHYPSAPSNELYMNGLKWLDGERFLFGSAYPCYDMRQAVSDFKRFDFDPAITKKVLWDNAHNLLKLG